MQRIAWKSVKKNGGVGKASINHYTADNKKTLCGKKIPGNGKAFCYDAFGTTDCDKCDTKRTRLIVPKTYDDKLKLFKEVIAELEGNYEFDDKHRGWWDAYGDKKNLYIAYGRLAPFMDVWMYENWLIFQESPV